MVSFGVIVADEFIDCAPQGGFPKKYHTVQHSWRTVRTNLSA